MSDEEGNRHQVEQADHQRRSTISRSNGLPVTRQQHGYVGPATPQYGSAWQVAAFVAYMTAETPIHTTV